ncbi:MAG: N-acetylmuramoyl-L-alanine amidase [Elusimicrobiales bacterium]|nr:N-acetylmuramoyl-L-alanine amidase [Elusimicrobiales bacterium]
MKTFRNRISLLIAVSLLASGAGYAGGLAQLSGVVSAFRKTVSGTVPKALPPGPAAKGPRLICIDPGHPSLYSSGDAPQHGTTEVHINWVVALKLKDVLRSKGVEVMMTKSSEGQKVDNRDRALAMNKAAAGFLQNNKNGAALTVHLHCDSDAGSRKNANEEEEDSFLEEDKSLAPGMRRGFAIYYPDRQGTYTGVNGHGDDIGFTGPSEKIQAASKQLAAAVDGAMLVTLKNDLKDLGVKGDSRTLVGSRQGALSYSIFSEIPTITIEMVMLSNELDAKFIKSEAGQRKMAEAIAAGVLDY